MTRTIHGLTFQVFSPSAFKLAGREIWLHRVFFRTSLNGRASHDEIGWLLEGWDDSGSIYFRVDNRDHGAMVLADAMQKAAAR